MVSGADDTAADGGDRIGRSNRHRWAALVAAGLLAACGSSSTSSPAGTDASSVAPSTTTTTTTTDQVSTTAAPVTTEPSAPGGQRNPGGQYGEYGIYQRVNFPAGSTGTTVSAGVAQGTVNGHLLRAAAGQKMTITLDGLNALFDAYGPDDEQLANGDSGGDPVVIDPLPADGDYLVVVSSVRGGAAYDLTVAIESPSGSTASPASCATYTEFEGDYPMRLCHKGDLVRDVQQALSDLGYDLDVDGFFGPGTAEVLADYFDDGVPELMPPDIEVLLFEPDE